MNGTLHASCGFRGSSWTGLLCSIKYEDIMLWLGSLFCCMLELFLSSCCALSHCSPIWSDSEPSASSELIANHILLYPWRIHHRTSSTSDHSCRATCLVFKAYLCKFPCSSLRRESQVPLGPTFFADPEKCLQELNSEKLLILLRERPSLELIIVSSNFQALLFMQNKSLESVWNLLIPVKRS